MTDNIAKFPPIPRAEGGRFAVGGPGRPKGARGKAAKATLDRIKSFGPDALQALHEAIRAKERWAVEYCLNKIVPHNSRTIEFEGLDIEDIREAFKAGDISVSEMKDIITAITSIAEMEELAEIKQKLDVLEAHANGTK